MMCKRMCLSWLYYCLKSMYFTNNFLHRTNDYVSRIQNMGTCYQHITVLLVGNQYKMKSSAMVYELKVFENCLYN